MSLRTTSPRQNRTILNSHIPTGRRVLGLVNYRLGNLSKKCPATESCDWCRAGHVTPSTSRSVATDGVGVVTVFPQDDLGPFTLYTRSQLDSMELDQRVFLWFSAHDWDEDEALDGLELVKARVLQF